MSVPLPALSLLETRVLGVLVEKQHTVPDAYPLTLNALVAGCNQKTSRDPVIDASDAEVQAAVDHLRMLSLVVESSGGRVMRYAHNVERVLERAVAIGRAPGRADAARAADGRRAQDQHRAAAPLRRRFGGRGLPARTGPAFRGGARRRIAAAAGRARDAMGASAGGRSRAREPSPRTAPPGDSLAASELAALKANVDRLSADVAALKATVARLCVELGITT